jgi:hypothetical protein
MALISYASIPSKVRGSIGQTTYSGNKSGNTVLARTRPHDPKTTLQTNQRARWNRCTATWNALSPSDRSAWSAFSIDSPEIFQNKLRERIWLSGYSMYQVIYNRRIAAGESPPFAIPTPNTIINTTLVTVPLSLSNTPPGAYQLTQNAGSNWSYVSVYLGFAKHYPIQYPTTGMLYYTTIGYAPLISGALIIGTWHFPSWLSPGDTLFMDFQFQGATGVRDLSNVYSRSAIIA